jgi:hypothetical protein
MFKDMFQSSDDSPIYQKTLPRNLWKSDAKRA